jgi:hypothetical protein
MNAPNAISSSGDRSPRQQALERFSVLQQQYRRRMKEIHPKIPVQRKSGLRRGCDVRYILARCENLETESGDMNIVLERRGATRYTGITVDTEPVTVLQFRRCNTAELCAAIVGGDSIAGYSTYRQFVTTIDFTMRVAPGDASESNDDRWFCSDAGRIPSCGSRGYHHSKQTLRRG